MKGFKEICSGIEKVISLDLLGGAEETHGKPQLVLMV
jgi:hypothetical protein